ncbi:MAG: hypothetical protein WAO41_05640 [Candidatus Nanopelagicales bacterium]
MTDTDPVAASSVGLGWPGTPAPAGDVSRETTDETTSAGLGWPTEPPDLTTESDPAQS